MAAPIRACSGDRRPSTLPPNPPTAGWARSARLANRMSILLGLLVTGHRFHLDGCDRRGLRRHRVILGRYTPDLQSFRHVENQPRGEGNNPKTANAAASVRDGEVGLNRCAVWFAVELKRDLDN